MTDVSTMRRLAEKWLNGTITEEEKQAFETWYNEQPDKLEWIGDSSDETVKQRILNAIYSRIEEYANVHEIPAQRISLWKRIAVAASIILMLGAGSYFLFFNGSSKKDLAEIKQINNDVNPGGYKAKLKLADGKTIVLDSAAAGELAKEGNTTIINKGGKLVYETGADSYRYRSQESVAYNTVVTNKGETYSFTLADGSKVWLNSGSSVHFPVAFAGKERRIEITGEVYVKVAHNPAQPFIASVNGMEVLALGTEFNINSYSDEENISATLVEGTVKVSKGTATTILKPGQQAQLNNNGELSKVKDVNLSEVTSWKDGWFHFESSDLKTILRQFARWYDVEVVYEGPVKDRKFLAIVKRSNTLKTVLEILKDNDIIYQIEGKKLIVKSG